MGIVIITICIAASFVLAGIGLVMRMLLGLKRDIAVNRAVLRASLIPPTETPPPAALESESEKARRRHGMHIVRSGPVALLAVLAWRARRHAWRTAGISSAAVGFGTVMVAVFALGAPPTPPGTPPSGQPSTIGTTAPVAAPVTAPTATGAASASSTATPSTAATSSAATNNGAQTVVVVAAPKSSTIPVRIPTPTLAVPVPSLSTVKAPIAVSGSSSCAVAATVPALLGVCVL